MTDFFFCLSLLSAVGPNLQEVLGNPLVLLLLRQCFSGLAALDRSDSLKYQRELLLCCVSDPGLISNCYPSVCLYDDIIAFRFLLLPAFPNSLLHLPPLPLHPLVSHQLTSVTMSIMTSSSHGEANVSRTLFASFVSMTLRPDRRGSLPSSLSPVFTGQPGQSNHALACCRCGWKLTDLLV